MCLRVVPVCVCVVCVGRRHTSTRTSSPPLLGRCLSARNRRFPPISPATPRKLREPAWHRKDRRERADARVLVRLGRAAKLLGAHHSAQRAPRDPSAMRWDGPDVVKGAPKEPPWGCGSCGEVSNWACRAKCRGNGCRREAPNHVLSKLRVALASANAGAGNVASAGRCGHRGPGRQGATPAPWRQGAGVRRGGGWTGKVNGLAEVPLPTAPPVGVSAEDWKKITEQHAAAKCQPAAGPAAMLPVDPPFGVDPDEWKAIRSKNEAAIKQQVSAAAAKATPQQLLQAAEKATRLRAELERQCAAATQKLEKLAQSLQDARAKEQECREASLRAQVPSVGELPCSADHLLDGLLAKAAPQLAGTPECNRLKRHLEEAVRVANAELGQRLEQAKAEADERAKADALKAQETAEAAATPAGGALDMDWDLDGLDDDTLRAVDPSHQQPQGEGADEAMEGWRVVQRGKARKAAEVAGVLATHKKLKVDQLCG